MNADRRHQTPPADELRELGRAIDIPYRDPDLVAEQVMARLAASGRTVRTRRSRWRPALAAAFAVLVVLALTPPVRAAVTEWFGVVITQGEPTGSATVPEADGDLNLEDAGDLVPFDPIVPDRLLDAYGPPDGVEVSDDRRVLSLSWAGDEGTIRLDAFEGEISPIFLKRAEPEQVSVAGRPAIWIRDSHVLVPLDPEGQEYVDLVRSADSTLIWQVGDLTLRLEGLERAAAIEVAESTVGTG